MTRSAAGSGAPFGLAFLGCGGATRMHSRTLRSVDPALERFYASRDAVRAVDFSERFGGAGAFVSYDAALADPRVHAVMIATPPSTHLDLTLRALAAGRHVIVEKPPYLSVADFDRVRRARDAAGRQVLVAENYFYKPMALALRRLLASGALGEVRFIQINALKHQSRSDWRDDPAVAGGGALFEGGIHWVSFLANIGLRLTSIRGVRAGGGPGPERSTLVVAEYEGGAVGTLAHSWEIPSAFRGLRLSRIYGTRGSATFESNGLFLLVRGRGLGLRLPAPRDMLGFRAMFADFLRALRTGAEPAYTFDLARRDLELVETIVGSSRRHGVD